MQTSKPRLWTKDFIIIWQTTFLLTLMYFLTMTTITGYVIEKFDTSQSKAGLAASIFVIGVLTPFIYG
ncbi:hypothetical protein [Alkalihalobacillus deserti]|uniref:hypothetical protein n=1 Tax=Alkalihalobacillus deserti TaxID=2879466 RepID=UPI001D139D35|nr:hypothetical protein [Alkalihalobacillus deserti]